MFGCGETDGLCSFPAVTRLAQQSPGREDKAEEFFLVVSLRDFYSKSGPPTIVHTTFVSRKQRARSKCVCHALRGGHFLQTHTAALPPLTPHCKAPGKSRCLSMSSTTCNARYKTAVRCVPRVMAGEDWQGSHHLPQTGFTTFKKQATCLIQIRLPSPSRQSSCAATCRFCRNYNAFWKSRTLTMSRSIRDSHWISSTVSKWQTFSWYFILGKRKNLQEAKSKFGSLQLLLFPQDEVY
ncbi:hypothetical protein GWK47_017802 [Chionoecetes opilio]|uniref:Uncharacterized protein n=1 Tax=Chionoecetes opilio TaxID=41210 RepID=A0A8J4XRC0_CHIOP|nr:hypothetical protein GWK47_017802 [Chionoecetes opilio]